MMKNTKSAKSLAVGDVFRPNADKRFANTWYRATRVFPGQGQTTIEYTIEGADDFNGGRFSTASLATMEVR